MTTHPKNPFRQACQLLLCGVLVTIITNRCTRAQEDMFGGTAAEPTDIFAGGADPAPATTEAATSAPGDDLLQQDPDPVVRMLRSERPKTPAKMADGLTWTIRLKRWDEVGRLLDQVNANGWTVEQRAEIARQLGTAMLLRMRANESALTPAQAAMAKEIQMAPGTLARQPEWIDQNVLKLGSGALADRQLATARLHDAGSIGLERLVNRLLAGDTEVAPERLAAAAATFARPGVEALRAATLVADPAAAGRVHLALAALPVNDFSAEHAAGLSSRTLPAAVQQELMARLVARKIAIPTPEQIDAYLTKRFDSALATYQLERRQVAAVNDYTWRPTLAGNTIERIETSAADKQLEAVAHLAAQRMKLQNTSDVGLATCAAVLLQRAYKIRPQLHAGELPSHYLAEFPPEVQGNVGWWQQVFAQCSNLQLHGGAIRSLQMLGEGIAIAKFEAPLEFLTKLLRDPRPAIRYTAFELIERLDPKSSYYGDEWTLETAIELSRLGTGPHALVIGLQSDLRQAAQHQIRLQTGGDVSVVNSGVAALKMLDDAVPTELIVIVDRVADQTISQLVQRLRKSERGRSLPIAILTDDLYEHERNEISRTPGVVTSILSRDPKQMERVLQMLVAQLDTTPLSSADRSSLTASASRFMARIAADRDQYGFYPLTRWQSVLVDTSSTSNHGISVALLSAAGSAESQRKLAWMTAASDLDEQQRLSAARAFGRSVRKFGMAMQRGDVVQAYDLYNQVGPKDPVAVKAMGLVLDIIEAQAGKAPWPEGL